MRRVFLAALALCALACSGEEKPEQAEATVRIGAVMLENGRRFEIAGHAAAAERWELAEYEAHEIIELFEADMPRAPLPGECDDAAVDRIFERISNEELPALRTAAHERSAERFGAAYRRVAASCNGCHVACQVAFVEVPTAPGGEVPSLERLP